MKTFKTAVVVPASAGYPQTGPIVATHTASSREQAERIACEEVCSDTGFLFRNIDKLVVVMCIKLTKPTRSQILHELQDVA